MFILSGTDGKLRTTEQKVTVAVRCDLTFNDRDESFIKFLAECDKVNIPLTPFVVPPPHFAWEIGA